jgi:hypothetical protein
MMTEFLVTNLAPPGVRLVVTSYSYQDTGSASRRYHGAIPLISQPHHDKTMHTRMIARMVVISSHDSYTARVDYVIIANQMVISMADSLKFSAFV